MDPVLRALNRFGLGARVGEPRIRTVDPREWLLAQLHPPDALLHDPDLPVVADVGAIQLRLREAQRGGRRADTGDARRELRAVSRREVDAALRRRLTTDAPFLERLVAFWSNHLCVSTNAGPPGSALAGLYEREAIRPHVLGRFEDMLLASARHPAMLIYLDNARSVGPASRAARLASRRNANVGLNENYARELLELHTVGVDGGYRQADVEAAARIFTGWTVDAGAPGSRLPFDPFGPPSRGDLGFLFRHAIHDVGAAEVMGTTYGPAGQAEGEELIRDLARHPATARFLAGKLARHFVSDDPPPSAVDRLADVFLETEGDLLELSRALVDLPEAWDPEQRKFRTPQDWVVAALRAVRVEKVPQPMAGLLDSLRQPLWSPSAPKGYDDTASVWADPDGLMNRAELARSLGEVAEEHDADPAILLEVVEPDGDGALETMVRDTSIPAAERVALVLGGPAFQWR